jgi:hypothetical protein
MLFLVLKCNLFLIKKNFFLNHETQQQQQQQQHSRVHIRCVVVVCAKIT